MARLRKKARTAPSADESVDLGDADHAWWTNGTVNHVPTGPTAAPEEPTETSEFFAEWSTDSLFVTGAETTTPTNGLPGDDGYTGPPLFAVDEAYLLLGLDQDASWDEIVSAHRKLAKRYHPDRLVNASPEARARGEQRMAELNVAYESLQRLVNPPTRSLFTA